jgi:hypothetical protein
VKKRIFRIIDANVNRSREGLRVCEEVTRFALDSEALTKQLKNVRNAVSNVARDFEDELGALAHSRDTAADIGRASRLPGSINRNSIRDIFTANMERVKESLRVLEEFFKLIDPAASMKFSRLRFKAYDIEKKAVQRIESLRHCR